MQHFREEGYPGLAQDPRPFWHPMSMIMNANRICMPLLLQLSDDEYLGAVEPISVMREVGRPVDMIVFPGEHHVKWQPSHRLAIYERSVDWFDFWLKGRENPAPIDENEYQRWRLLRERGSPSCQKNR